MIDRKNAIQELLSYLYGRDLKDDLFNSVWQRIKAFKNNHPQPNTSLTALKQLTEKDTILITYGDQFREPGRPPLQSLGAFVEAHLKDLVSGLHILPFYPYSSDDGFSVIDFRQVAPELGNWEDINRLDKKYILMFDLVANHVSARSEWFQNFLADKSPYDKFFHVLNPSTELASVVRPRTTPLMTSFQTSTGVRDVWTTFSPDQIDLDYGNPRVFLEMLDILLFYVAQGARIIRLDAIAYLWKVPGTSCIHLPQTHAVVKLFRAILDTVAPSVLLITETNVPHQENISYFGSYLPEVGRTDEAQMVYQFPLAPLLMHTFLSGDSTHLTDWVEDLPEIPVGTTFLNFTASHDGIGLRPAEGLLSRLEIEALVQRTLEHGGQISYKSNPDGSRSAYELNVTWYDALNDPSNPEPELDIHRFLASQSIMLSLAGVPGIYLHSLFGSRNCVTRLEETGLVRSINREKFQLAELEDELADPHCLKSRVLAGYRLLLQQRKGQPAFDPSAWQQVLHLDGSVFALMRTTKNEERVICMTNVTAQVRQIDISLSNYRFLSGKVWIDLLTGECFRTENDALEVPLSPYQSRWLKGE